MLRPLAEQRFLGGYSSSHPLFRSDLDIMGEGSENVLITGTGKTRIWEGLGTIGSVVGSLAMFNTGETYAGLGGPNQTTIGSVFRVLGSLFYIGQGSVFYEGVDTTEDASVSLSLMPIAGGSFGTAVQAGLAEPSAPVVTTVDAPTGFTGKNNGAVSIVITRLRSTTGAESNGSPVSAVVVPVNQSVVVTLPAADGNGQDYWGIYGTKNAEGGLGLHYLVSQISEATVAEAITVTSDVKKTTGVATIGVPNGTFDSTSYIGWEAVLAGESDTYITNINIADDSHSAGYQQVTLSANLANTATVTGTFTRAIAGVTRSVVVEWRDADLIGEPIAPIRNYPPPAGVFAGVINDVTFVDGCYGDTANVVATSEGGTGSSLADGGSYSKTNIGNAIAISDPLYPEAFPPDNYIFTGDSPTCLLAGSNGVYWRFGENSLGIIRYVGGSPTLTYERVWTGVGVQRQQNATLGQGGRVYAYTADRGAVRMAENGMPDTLFAAPVADDMAGWDPDNVVLGFDGDLQLVLYMHNTTILAFYEPLGVWCAPLTVTSAMTGTTYTVRSCVTVDGQARITFGTISTLGLYTLQGFTSGAKGTIVTPWIQAQGVSDNINRVKLALRTDSSSPGNVVMNIYANGDASTSRRTFTQAGSGAAGHEHMPVWKPNVRNCKSWQIKIEYTHDGAGNDTGVDLLQVEGEPSQITW